MRLGILGSGRGTDLLALIDAIKQKKLLAEIAIVVSNKPDAIILERAEKYQLKTKLIETKGLSRIEYDEEISAVLNENNVDLIVLIGYLRILSNKFVARWRNNVINVHPSLLPAFAGGIDHDVHRAVLNSGVKETGCTVHYVTEEVDAGPIIVQKKCAVLPNDSVELLKTRVQALEGEALVEAISMIYHGNAF